MGNGKATKLRNDIELLQCIVSLFHSLPLSKSKNPAALIDGERGNICQDGHIGNHNNGPAPAIGFAFDDGDRCHALAGKDEKHHQ